MFAHIDCDCFFVSVELIDKPHLKGKPICVAGPHKDAGVVVSASYEARPFGIRAGMPVFKAKELCPQVIFLYGGMLKYSDVSKEIFNYFHQISPSVEHMSIDEGFLDLTNLDRIYGQTWEEMADHIQKKVLKYFKIPISIGIGSTKTLAKLGSKYNKPFGNTIITNKNRQQILDNVDIGEITGIGKKSEHKVRIALNINTAGDFAKLNLCRVKNCLGSNGTILWHELNGVKIREICEDIAVPKSILRSSMFSHKNSNPHLIYHSLCARLEEALKKLRRFNLEAAEFGVFLRKNYPNKASTTIHLTNHKSELTEFLPHLKKAFQKIYDPQTTYRASGVFLHKLKEKELQKQELPFSNNQAAPETTPFISLLHDIEQKLGKNQVTTLSRMGQTKRKPDTDLAFSG